MPSGAASGWGRSALRWARVVALAAAGGVALGAATCAQKPKILLPANATQIAAAGSALQIDLGQLPGPKAVVQVLLFRAVDEKPVTSIDVSALVSWAGALGSGNLGSAELREGRNRILVSIDSDGDGIFDRQASSIFSWEPNVDVSDADRCDPLDATRCLYPFPNDYFTVPDPSTPTGLRVHIDPTATPDSGGTNVDPSAWNALDGWSVGPMLLFQIPDLDLAQTGAPPITDLARSLDPSSPIAIVDAQSGERQLFWAERDVTSANAAQRPLILRVGRNLPNAHRYVVALRNPRDAAGAPIAAGRLFRLYRDAIPTYLPAVEARRAHMEQLFATLAQAGIPRHELALAWDFTTQSVQSVAGKMLHMRDDAFSMLGSAAPAFHVDSVVEPLDSEIFRRVDGTFQVPLYLTDGGVPGSRLRLGSDGLPVNEGDSFTALFRCIIPYSATTNGAAPVHLARPSLYGHGLLGSEEEVTAGNVRDMAAEHDFVFCATRWSGMEELDQSVAVDVLGDFSLFPELSGRLHQGLLNFLFLGRLLIHAQGFASDPAFQVGGQSVIDPSELFYDGNSQGGILGGGLAAYAQDYTRAVLGVPGMNFSTLLSRSQDFDTFNKLFRVSYPNGFDRQLLESMAEMLWEETEASGGALHLTADPYPGTPAKKILLHEAFGDHQVANVATEVEARSIGARLHTPALTPTKAVPDVTPFYGIDAIASYPFDGSALVVWDSGNPAPPTSNTPPRLAPTDPAWAQLLPCAQGQDGGDPHECPRRQPSAREQKSQFLQSSGAVVDVCGAGPCFAP